MFELLLQHQNIDSFNRNNPFIDETDKKIYGRIINDRFVICTKDCIEALKYYYLDELKDEQEINTLLVKRKKIELLNSLFNKELGINKSYLKMKENKISTIFSKVINYLIDLKYNKISLEFTPDSSIFLNILLNDKFKAHIEFYLIKENENYNNAFFNLFKQKESILSGYGKLTNIVNELNEYT